MDEEEARAILNEQLSQLKSRSYEELLGLMQEGENFEITAPSGKEYQVEIQVFWDDQPGGDLRIIGSIDDGGLRAFFPLSDSFLMGPDSSIEAENVSA